MKNKFTFLKLRENTKYLHVAEIPKEKDKNCKEKRKCN